MMHPKIYKEIEDAVFKNLQATVEDIRIDDASSTDGIATFKGYMDIQIDNPEVAERFFGRHIPQIPNLGEALAPSFPTVIDDGLFKAQLATNNVLFSSDKKWAATLWFTYSTLEGGRPDAL